MEGDTESLRKAAPHWTLDGDKQLLGMLQKIHQKIMTKCKEANVKLDVMVDALDSASIDLQNVNNKFMALSNNQFVESRVYDDDVDVSAEVNIAKTDPSVVEAESEIAKLKRSLQRLEQMHEPVHILDSDSSDEEDDGRIILKPKDMYSHRPLPYIIGTQAWKSKWHAGLIQEESDSDSSVSKHENIPPAEYSESEPETVQTDKLEHRTISSSSMESEMVSQPQTTTQVTSQPAKPADIAAELARRLGGPVHLPASKPVEIQTPPEQTSKKVYRVEKPAPTTIFSDEPPPLDDYQSYKSDYTDDDDIFAELHKKPNLNTNKDQSSVAKDLFGGLSDNVVDDLFGQVDSRDNDIGNVMDYQHVKPSASSIQNQSVSDERQQSKSVAEKPALKTKPIETKAETEGAIKKPVGGISLFGTSKGAENIGAAILKRNQRKSSTSDEDTSNAIENKVKVTNESKEEPVKKIIEDLFSKPSKKVIKKEIQVRREEPEKVKPTKDKIDLFSDNLFDDIDDIFVTNIVTKPKDNKPQKSIFDDDDLFADITLKKPEEHNKSKTESIFDKNKDISENLLKTDIKFNNNPINVDKDDMYAKENVIVNMESDKKAKRTVSKGLFDEDSDSDLFTDVRIVNENSNPQKPIIENIKEVTLNNKESKNQEIFNPNSGIINTKGNDSDNKSLSTPVTVKPLLTSPSLFDDDEFDDLFSVHKKTYSEQSNINNVHKDKAVIPNSTITETKKADKTLDEESISKQIKSENNVISGDKNNVMAGETNKTHIPNEIGTAKISVPVRNFAASEDLMNDMLDQTQYTKAPNITDEDHISNKSEHFIHSETLYEDINNIQSPNVIPEMEKSETIEPNIFSDIFIDMPPAFEKPLEPKKSKNVNALFDDDSDDEALFFKKNEAISDEKPGLNVSSDRFRIFHDEPPDIEVNFSQEPLKNASSSLSELSVGELLESVPKLQAQDKENEKDSITNDNEYRKNIDITKIIEESEALEKNQKVDVSKPLESFIENTETDLKEDTSDTPEERHGDPEIIPNKDLIEENDLRKSIGKLKHVNLNINVNTLLPGASLKKSKTKEETDGQTISTKSNEELNIFSPEQTETKMVKSVSFDGDPESEILDNNLSKQRAKIQVKRRPSSRKARLEAVRKSRIDLASDSTDNSSSFDEPPYKEIVNRERLEINIETNITRDTSNTLKKNTITADTPSLKHISPMPEIFQPNPKPTDISSDLKTTSPDIKSKVVYILNDEDIFSNINPRKENNTERNEVLANVDDDDEFLFRAPNISTLGKTYETTDDSSSSYLKTEPKITLSKKSDQKNIGVVTDKLPESKKSLFGDLSDDENELFGTRIPAVQKLNAFDSDSESKLFVKSKRESKSTVESMKETIKGSLFGDESDDDSDLFGVKKPSGNDESAQKSSGTLKPNVQKQKEVTAKTSEPVFEDPLSMFSDDS